VRIGTSSEQPGVGSGGGITAARRKIVMMVVMMIVVSRASGASRGMNLRYSLRLN
jgi:hypothetical protein